MKKINCFLIFIAVFFVAIINVKANSVNKISMDIEIDSNGTAHITEIWNVTSSQGTEIYKSYYNMGKSKIENFKVSLNDTYFENIS